MKSSAENTAKRSSNADKSIILLISALIGLLAILKLATLVINFGNRLLDDKNPLFDFLPNWFLTELDVVLESWITFQLIRNRNRPENAGLWLIWLSTLLAIYRGGLWLVSPPGTNCKCLGLLGVFIRFGSIRENHISLGLLAFFSIAGMYLFIKGKKMRFVKRFVGPIIFIYIACFVPTLAAAADPVVKIEGTIKYTYFDKNRKTLNSSSSQFEVFRDGKGWRLTATQPPSDVYSIGFNGNAMFSLIASTNESSKIDAAIIDPENFPIATMAESIPWWFFCLSKEVNAKVEDMPTPWSCPRADFQAFFCTRAINWSQSDPYLMSDAAFNYSSNKVVASYDSPIINRQFPSRLSFSKIAELAQKLKDLQLPAGKCSVTTWTNTPFGKFPRTFQMLVFSSLAEQERGDGPVTRIESEGEVTNISRMEAMVYEPPLARKISTVDFRFNDPQNKTAFLQYGPLTAWTINKTDVDVSKARIVKDAVVTSPVKIMYIKKAVFWLLIAVTILPVLVWLKVRTGKVKTKQQT